MNKFTRSFKISIVAVFLVTAVLVGGCGYVNEQLGGWNKKELEQQVKDQRNTQLKEASMNFWCQRVSLTQSDANHYTGIIYYAAPDGTTSQGSVSVTTDKDSWVANFGP